MVGQVHTLVLVIFIFMILLLLWAIPAHLFLDLLDDIV